MTTPDSLHESHDCGGDAAAYVLGALEGDEAAAFRTHIAGCVVCRDEVAALQGVADALPMAAPQLPAQRTLRRRIMSRVRREPRGSRAAAGRSRFRLLGARPGLARPALAAGAVFAAIGVAVVGGLELASSGSRSTRTVQARVVGSSASAYLRLSGGHAELVMRHMPRPPAGKIYEVWVRRGARPPSPTSALFSVTSAGTASVGVPGDIHGVSQVLVTSEPFGGRLAPTAAPVIVAET